MKIFISHHSSQKELIESFRKFLPSTIEIWIDDERIVIGDDVSTKLETAINTDTDYLLLFWEQNAAKSGWVSKEIKWALKKEREIGRTFLLVVLLGNTEAPSEVDGVDISRRKYVRLGRSDARGLFICATEIADELLGLLSRDLSKARTQPDILAQADRLHEQVSDSIFELLTPHRRSNPMPFESLGTQIEKRHGVGKFERLFETLRQRQLLPGVKMDQDRQLFIDESHRAKKAKLNVEDKERVAQRACREIQSGDTVAIDAGSTLDLLVRLICQRLRYGTLERLRIITNSVSAAGQFLELSTTCGLDDDCAGFQLFVPGGLLRHTTSAMVSYRDERQDITAMMEDLGGADIGFVGANGISHEGRITTHSPKERVTKRQLLDGARKRFVIADASKIGIPDDQAFADADDDVTLIVNDCAASQALRAALAGKAMQVVACT